MIPKMTPKMTKLLSPVSQNVIIKSWPEFHILLILLNNKYMLKNIAFRESKCKGEEPLY